MSTLKETSPAIFIVLILVIGGLAYLLLPGRLNGPSSSETSTSTASSTELQMTTTGATTSSPTP